MEADLQEYKLDLTNQINKEIEIIPNVNGTAWFFDCYNYNNAFDLSGKIKLSKSFNIESWAKPETKIVDFSYNAKFQNIQKKFEIEFSKYSNYILSDKVKARQTFNNISQHIYNIVYEKIVLEITPSNAVKFTLILNETTILAITKPFENLDSLGENEVVFNLYRDRELLISDAMKINELVKGINNYANM